MSGALTGVTDSVGCPDHPGEHPQRRGGAPKPPSDRLRRGTGHPAPPQSQKPLCGAPADPRSHALGVRPQRDLRRRRRVRTRRRGVGPAVRASTRRKPPAGSPSPGARRDRPADPGTQGRELAGSSPDLRRARRSEPPDQVPVRGATRYRDPFGDPPSASRLLTSTAPDPGASGTREPRCSCDPTEAHQDTELDRRKPAHR